jgi:hypothetical protein
LTSQYLGDILLSGKPMYWLIAYSIIAFVLCMVAVYSMTPSDPKEFMDIGFYCILWLPSLVGYLLAAFCFTLWRQGIDPFIVWFQNTEEVKEQED